MAGRFLMQACLLDADNPTLLDALVMPGVSLWKDGIENI